MTRCLPQIYFLNFSGLLQLFEVSPLFQVYNLKPYIKVLCAPLEHL